MPIFFSEFLDNPDTVLVFDEFMEGIDLEKYLKVLPKHKLGCIRYNPFNMLKTVLFSFMQEGVRIEIFLVSIGHNLYKYYINR